MAYTDYTPDQINQFINSKGVGSDPWAMLAYAKQYNADPMAVAAARGIDPTAAQEWLTGAQQQMAGPIQDTRGLADRNPYMAYMVSANRGQTADQAGAMYGKDGNTVNGWLQNAGLSLGSPAAAPSLQVGGTQTPVANTPQQYQAGPVTGNATGTMTPGSMSSFGAPPSRPSGSANGQWVQNGTGWVPDNGGGNPYLPAGGQGSNGMNDPRIGGPAQFGAMGNQGMQGLADYLFQNPSTRAMGNEVTRGVMNALQRQALPAIRGNAMAAGTVGGSRQGVAEGLATGEAMTGLAGALANLYGNQFNQDRGYGLQSDALDFNIHRGNLQDMRQGQLDQLGFLNQMTNWGQQGIGVANQTRDRPFTDWQRFVQPASQMAGLGGSQTQNLQGNPYLGAIGGYLAGTKAFGG